ncbi:MAG: proprotein convertase P-domain-containing protein [Gaiellaceae bacterium]
MKIGVCVASLVLSCSFFALTLVSARAQTRTSACTMAEFKSGGRPLPIPDPGAAESTVSVSATGSVQSVAVVSSITHPFDSDLQVQLVSPAGKAVTLAQAIGTWGRDFADTVFADDAPTSIVSALPPFTGRFRPVAPLAAFTGASATGTWTLRVTDQRAGYSGQLDGWSLQLTSCASVRPPAATTGAPDPPALPTGVPAGQVPLQGQLITVTTNSDVSNGDVSSVAKLQASPGPDGISLREAITATNNDPGTYTIRFAPSLAGTTIQVGSAAGFPLPPLLAGGVLIDGDVNGDGRPDITLSGQQIVHDSRCGLCALSVISSGNHLHALALEHFSVGVHFAPVDPDAATPTLPSGQTYAGNTVSGVAMTDITADGISFFPNAGLSQCTQTTACQTHNEWRDTRLVGNTIASTRNGIEAQLIGSVGDAVNGITVAGNDISIAGGFGVNLSAGAGGGADQNQVSDALIAYNSIAVNAPGFAINTVSGLQGGSANVVENATFVGNHIVFSGAVPAGASARGISIVMSDGCTDDGAQRICSKNNVAKSITIEGNLLQGQDQGVLVTDSCCGTATGSTVIGVRIAGNVINGVVAPDRLNPWGVMIGSGGAAVSDVTVDSNTITQQTTDPASAQAASLAGGGVAILGGLGKEKGSIQNVSVTSNRIDTDLVGITLVGGGPSDEPAAFDAIDNSVSRVVLRRNVIGRVPALIKHWDSTVKGISVIGGLGGNRLSSGNWSASTGNSVTGITLDHNVVAGVIDAVSVHANLGTGASGNTVGKVTRLGVVSKKSKRGRRSRKAPRFASS